MNARLRFLSLKNPGLTMTKDVVTDRLFKTNVIYYMRLYL